MSETAEKIVCVGVTEYAEGEPVTIQKLGAGHGADRANRLVVCATNQGGHDGTAIDLTEFLWWVKKCHPDWLDTVDQLSIDYLREPSQS
jgi:predicted alpha/beta-fold hydrolase